ncbi:MAG: hypothetical protein M3389_02300 [Actinomycetota bacterium]|nr:hypothetical protein [Actinomycetota bacterium]
MQSRATHRRRAVVLALVVAGLAAGPAAAQEPEPNFAGDVVSPRPCAYDVDDPRERKFYEIEGWSAPSYERYPGHCRRMKFSYGPIAVKPGQNDVLIGPVTIEKPNMDGYVTRFKPNLVRADGSTPPVEQVHLHHGTWLAQPEYGSGPFFAAGEEKTIGPWPRGYGMPIKATDTWLLLYMVHSAVAEPMEAYITYEIDFVPEEAAQEIGLKPAYPVWLDVRPSGYPVFNVQRKYGGRDDECTWPAEQCADFDPFGNKFTGQGEPGNGTGTDLELPKLSEPFGRIEKFTGGTLIGIGGHLHPGGLTNDIDLVRPGGEDVTRTVREPYKVKRRVTVRKRVCLQRRRGKCVKRSRTKRKVRRTRTVTKYRERQVNERVDRTRIYTGRAWYWDREDKTKPGGPPTSWDFSMEVMGLPYWGIDLEPGDKLRSNATYDTKYAASYENMGIAVALLAPHDEEGKPTAPGLNPFQAERDTSYGCESGGVQAREKKLCARGLVTHGHYRENGNYGGPSGDWTMKRGQPTNEVGIANFLYEPGDLSTASMTGVPTVKLGETLRFTNLEGGLIYHTITSCRFPCLGQTGAAFPLPDGQTSSGRQLDIDSSELGFGVPEISAPKQRLDYELPVTKEEGYRPGETITYFCRVHPFMRGAFEVTE